jgi:hypothetical protein
MLALIVQQRDVLVIAARGVTNLAVGGVFLIAHGMQKRELARFGMEVDTEAMLDGGPGL